MLSLNLVNLHMQGVHHTHRNSRKCELGDALTGEAEMLSCGKSLSNGKPQSTIERPNISELVEYGSGANPLSEAPSTESP